MRSGSFVCLMTLSTLLKHPEYFRLFEAEETRNKYIKIVDKDPSLTQCAIEKEREREYREKGIDEESIRFAFIVKFPPGFKIGKYYKIAVWKWQRLPYWSPYEDISGYVMRSLEAQRRMEKRAVATIHELLWLTVEKMITFERIAHFRMGMNLPNKLKEFLLQHQGFFYISTRGNHGNLHTVFLRQEYRKGELARPNDLYLARRKLAELVQLSPRKAKMDHELINYKRRGKDDDRRGSERFYIDDSFDGHDEEYVHDGQQRKVVSNLLFERDDSSGFSEGESCSKELTDVDDSSVAE